MFDPDQLAAVRVRPAGDVASGEGARRGRLEVGVDHDAAIHPEAGRFGEPHARAHAEARHDEVGLDDAPVRQPDLLAVDRARGPLKMEDYAVLFMESANEIGEFGAQNALHRTLFRRDDMDLDIARPQGGRDFEPDEARAQHRRPPRRLGALDDGSGIVERAQHQHIGRVRAGDGRWRRLGPRREKEPIEGQSFPAGERDFPRPDVDSGDDGAETQIDRVVRIEAFRGKRSQSSGAPPAR